MGAGASAADGRLFCHSCGARTAILDGVECPCCTVCGATDSVEVTDARLPVTSPTSAMRALSRASLPSAPAQRAATSMRVESVTVVALERPEDGGLLLRVLPNAVARPRDSEPGSLSGTVSFVAEDPDQEDGELPAEPACDAFVSRLQASTQEAVGGHCVICAEDIVEHGTPVVTLNCQHSFHEGCIRRWLTRRHTCPTCRMELEVDDVRYLRSIGLKDEADALEKVKRELMAQEQQQQAAERRRWVDSMRRGEAVHFGLACGSCFVSPMVGECFRCKDCEDFVMCGDCYKHHKECHTPGHSFTPFGTVPCEPPVGLLTVLVPPARDAGPHSAAAEVAFAAVRSVALAPLAGQAGHSGRGRARERQ
ncbi:E3 ubiquitin-protein ligase RING1-like (RING finger protein 1) (RING-type E3 ubiquitin transferase RING1-like) [Durusdinium trenchii]|uniref:E3 ubiquitin-protein ligase RING1-like (RING finger protein 1) (RING-type E3 ubiquitin transferase RING1-like) n=1 Tax=Durusdinium trenchii TaxID=1381693 RepID=A0ABP0MHZ3_9DINO